ncbi:GMC family oxidoreductase N-terminal domain-containing protein, partial [Mesorhizobium sp. M0664]|uniref:GMC family oxidoreductase N-terminal domain-containing protein n=1 Tax=Mesorhizobium sp. M0664 TaxID=2956982 RepID=UPI0033389CFF
MNAAYDYIIAGAGSAGCTLANRLVNTGQRVLIVEAGPADNSRFIDMPATFAKVIGTARSWIYESDPEPSVGGRRLPVPQGRTLGGGSSINAMLYVRGQPQDYEVVCVKFCKMAWHCVDVGVSAAQPPCLAE